MQAANSLRDAPADSLRLEAALVLIYGRVEDRSVGETRLHEILDDRSVEDPMRRIALQALLSVARDETVDAVLKHVLGPCDSPDLRRAAIFFCRRRRRIEPLLATAPLDPTEQLRRVQALAAIGDEAAQPLLLEWLGRGERRVQIGAARALADLAGADSIARMAEIRVAAEGPVRKAIDRALAAIRRRSGVAQAGEISLASTAPLEGALSPAEGGEISLSE